MNTTVAYLEGAYGRAAKGAEQGRCHRASGMALHHGHGHELVFSGGFISRGICAPAVWALKPSACSDKFSALWREVDYVVLADLDGWKSACKRTTQNCIVCLNCSTPILWQSWLIISIGLARCGPALMAGVLLFGSWYQLLLQLSAALHKHRWRAGERRYHHSLGDQVY